MDVVVIRDVDLCGLGEGHFANSFAYGSVFIGAVVVGFSLDWSVGRCLGHC